MGAAGRVGGGGRRGGKKKEEEEEEEEREEKSLRYFDSQTARYTPSLHLVPFPSLPEPHQPSYCKTIHKQSRSKQVAQYCLPGAAPLLNTMFLNLPTDTHFLEPTECQLKFYPSYFRCPKR
ncbi:hypothetical protein O3P69_005162 [Scylla paramamosain]|uniref:Uncharacterized protein n=1 Tax=Scylla paramamosain TaxID=85552 RepID=A0AAW0UA54_SCYPA